MEANNLSRNAQLVALQLFPVYCNKQASFTKKARFDPRALSALGELEQHGLVTVTRHKGGAITYVSTRELRELMGEFGKVKAEEVFAITEKAAK